MKVEESNKEEDKIKLGQKLKRKHKELMNKSGRVTPHQVMGKTFREMPLYRLHKVGTKALKESYVASFTKKTNRRNSAAFARMQGQIRPTKFAQTQMH